MSYRLDRGPSVGHQLAILVGSELEAALASLEHHSPDAESVHEARRRVKRVRALLRLVEGPLGSAGTRFTRALRESSHALSAMREADANLESLAQLRKHWDSVITAPMAEGVRQGLATRKRESRVHADEVLELARKRLQQVREEAPDLVRSAGRFRVVRDGAVRAYRRTRRVMTGLTADAGDAEFHRWRRRLKDHYYHMRLFSKLHPLPRSRAGILNRLEETLGDDHNLTILADLILTGPERFGTTRDTAVVLGCISAEQHGLRLRALAQGQRAFRWKPGEFDARLADWWRSA